jgi:ADP-heptose:LPS heptosyltransferase
MTIPVIYTVARQYPELNITVLTRPFFARIFLNRPDNVDIITADTNGRHHGTLGLCRLIGELRRYRFEMVADLHDLLRSRLISLALRIHGSRIATVNKDRRSRRNITAAGGSRQPQRNYLLRYADTFAALGFPIEIDNTPIVSHTTSATPLIGIAPFARYATKTYPIDMMEQVVSLLSQRGFHILLYGSRGAEAATLESWAKRYQGAKSMAGRLPIEEEIASMATLDVMISMDSANMHLASLAGTPVISIWGGTTPECGFLGWQQPRQLAVCRNLECQPCSIAGTATCPRGSLDCLKGISPTEIADKISTFVNQQRQ